MFNFVDSDSEEEEVTPEDQPLDIHIHLDRAIYFVGQKLTGTIKIKNGVKRRIRGVKLTLRCVAQVQWIDVQRRKPIKRVNKDDLLYLEAFAHGDGTTIYLQADDHDIPFSMAIKPRKDQTLPSSRELPHGSIRYYLKAEVDWPWAEVHEHEKLVSVLDVVDFNTVLEAMQPATFTKTFRVGLTHRKIHIAGQLEKSGYVPGEEILLFIDIENESDKLIKQSMVQLIEIVKYYAADGSSTTSRNVIVSEDCGSISPRSDLMLEKFPVLIPALPQSHRSSLDFIKYYYEVSIVIITGKTPKQVSQKIAIGTIPNRHTSKRFFKGVPPAPELFVWSYSTLKRVPYPRIAEQPHNSEVSYGLCAEIDSEYKTLGIVFDYNEERALALFDENTESEESADEGDEEEKRLSDFSL